MPNPPKLLAEAYETWLDAQRRALELYDEPRPARHAAGLGGGLPLADAHREPVPGLGPREGGSAPADDLPEPGRVPEADRRQPGRELLVRFRRRPEERYRLYGNRGGAPYLGFTIGTDMFRGAQGRTGHARRRHYIDQFEVASNGDFEIVAAGERPPAHSGNFMRLPEGSAADRGARDLHDRSDAAPRRAAIERIGEAARAARRRRSRSPRSSPRCRRYLLVIVRTPARCCGRARPRTRTASSGVAGAQHVEEQENQVSTHSDTDMVYMGGSFRLEPGEALRHRPCTRRRTRSSTGGSCS